jgi:hypothetical protein
MHVKKLYIMLVTAGLMVLIVTGIALVTVQPVKAQCGSQASSCKNCHEVQAKDPVNNDGKSWHQSHAFGDFCYICHAGNNQATDKVAAHTGMVSPLADIKASCAQCHPNDLQARAQVYAVKLGVQLGSAAAPASAAPAPTAAASTSATPQPAAAVPQAALDPNDKNLVNYVQRYDENVLGEHPINWGNVILLVMIGALLIGGGALVISREGLVRVSFKDTRPVAGEYPADVVDMVPNIAKLKPNARKSLRRLLEKPDATAEVLTSIDKLTESKSSDHKDQKN